MQFCPEVIVDIEFAVAVIKIGRNNNRLLCILNSRRLFKFDNIIWSATNNCTEFFQCDHCDILVLFQGI